MARPRDHARLKKPSRHILIAAQRLPYAAVDGKRKRSSSPVPRGFRAHALSTRLPPRRGDTRRCPAPCPRRDARTGRDGPGPASRSRPMVVRGAAGGATSPGTHRGEGHSGRQRPTRFGASGSPRARLVRHGQWELGVGSWDLKFSVHDPRYPDNVSLRNVIVIGQGCAIESGTIRAAAPDRGSGRHNHADLPVQAPVSTRPTRCIGLFTLGLR